SAPAVVVDRALALRESAQNYGPMGDGLVAWNSEGAAQRPGRSGEKHGKGRVHRDKLPGRGEKGRSWPIQGWEGDMEGLGDGRRVRPGGTGERRVQCRV